MLFYGFIEIFKRFNCTHFGLSLCKCGREEKPQQHQLHNPCPANRDGCVIYYLQLDLRYLCSSRLRRVAGGSKHSSVPRKHI